MSSPQTMTAHRPARPARDRFRVTLTLLMVVLALAGGEGAIQLIAGVATPPLDDLEPLGLTSWVLPGVWLMGSVAVPSAAAAVALLRNSPIAVRLALLAAGLLAVELVVQIPFVGLSALQLVLGAVDALVVLLALKVRTRGPDGASPAPDRPAATDRG